MREDSDDTVPKDGYWQIRYKLKTIEEWRQDVNEDREKLEERIRTLEDYKLTSQVTHRNMVKWISVAAMALSAAISLLEHIIFK